MKNVLFRGADLRTDIWRYGYYHKIGSTHYIRVEHEEQNSVEDFRVNPETVGQCLFKKDMFGQNIFDGDVVDFDGTQYKVMWDESDSMFILSLSEDAIPVVYHFSYIDSNYLTVVGNIYEVSSI